MKTLRKSFEVKGLILALIISLGTLEVRQMRYGSDFWKPIKLNETTRADKTQLLKELSVGTLIFCAMAAGTLNTAISNSFCYKDKICQLFFAQPCQVSFDVKLEDDLECYANVKLEAMSRIYRNASYYKLVGCYWFTTVELVWVDNKKKCKEDGGQLISLEKITTQEEIDEFGFFNVSDPKKPRHVGLIRNGSKAEFTWLTGGILKNDSFMWHRNKPSNNHIEVMCGLAYTGIWDDDCFDLERYAACHLPTA